MDNQVDDIVLRFGGLGLSSSSSKNVGIFYDKRMEDHRVLGDHPEGPQRLKAIHSRLSEKGLLAKCITYKGEEIEKEMALLGHEETLWWSLMDPRKLSIHFPKARNIDQYVSIALSSSSSSSSPSSSPSSSCTYLFPDPDPSSTPSKEQRKEEESEKKEGEDSLTIEKEKEKEDNKEEEEEEEEEDCGDPSNFLVAGDLYYCHQSPLAIRLSAGTVITATKKIVQEREIKRSFCVVRPPGHHAESSQPMGFCFLNNVALSALYALQVLHLKRIAIFDFDVHHGNGTQEMFYEDPRVLFISIHRFENGFFYPTGPKGGHSYVGRKMGKGYNVNIPWEGTNHGDSEYMAAMRQIVLPILKEFHPQLIFISAGFDASEGDPLGGMNVTPVGFAAMTHSICQLAHFLSRCDSFSSEKKENKKEEEEEGVGVVMALEGGYNVDSISRSADACVRMLLGEDFKTIKDLCGKEKIERPSRNVKKIDYSIYNKKGNQKKEKSNEPKTKEKEKEKQQISDKILPIAKEVIENTIKTQSPYWRCLQKKNRSKTQEWIATHIGQY